MNWPRRLRLRSSLRISSLGVRAAALLAGAILVFYGAMAALLAVKVSPQTIDSLSGYRSVYDALAAIAAVDVGGGARLIAGISGAASLLVLGLLALGALPRPRFGRPAQAISREEGRIVEVAPRAFERLAEVGAAREVAVSGTRARYADECLELAIEVDSADEAGRVLGSIAARARDELRGHGLPEPVVDVTLQSFQATTRRNAR